MKHKKLFAILTLVCFMFTLMPVATMAEENVSVASVMNGTETTTYSSLQYAINAAEDMSGDVTITLLDNVEESVKITQKSGVNLVIDGNNNTFKGVMTVFGDGRQSGAETLVIQNVKFDANGNNACILSPSRTVYNKYSYSHNVTVKNCTFTDSTNVAEENFAAAAVRHQQAGDVDWVIEECTVDSTMHSLLQVSNTNGIMIKKCTVDASEGVNLNNSPDTTITESTFNVDGYAVRTGASSVANNSVEVTLENNEITAGTAIVLRSSAPNVELNMTENIVEADTDIDASAISDTTNVAIDANANYWGGEEPTTSGNLTVEVDSYYTDEEKTEVGYGEGVMVAIGANTYATLQEAINNAKDGDTITLLANVTEDVTVTQATNKVIAIDGAEKTVKGSITVDGKSARYATAGLTIKNVNFDGTDISADAIIRLGNGNNATRYTNNVTVEDCDFTGTGKVAIKSYTGGDWNLKVIGCTVDNTMHSLLQVTNVEKGLVIDNCTVNSKNGINLNNTPEVTITNSTIDVQGYALRVGVNGTAGGEGKDFVVENNTLKSACTDGDAVIMFRDNATQANLSMEENAVFGTTHISGITAETEVDADANYWDGKTAPVVAEGGVEVEVSSYYKEYDETTGLSELIVPVTGITLDKTTVTVEGVQEITLIATVTPSNTTDDLVWSSSDETVAIVDENGVVITKAIGTVTITAKAGDEEAACVITVTAVPVASVTLDKTTAEIKVDETVTLTATVAPENATNKTVTWTSSDETVATVADGVVTALKAGTVTITAASGEATATCEVTVKAKSSGYYGGGYVSSASVSIASDDNATVKVSDKYADKGETVTITVDTKDGFYAKDVVVTDKNGEAITVIRVALDKWEFTMPSGKVKVDVDTAEYSKEVVLQIGDLDIAVNDAVIQSDVAPFIKNDRTMVPISVIVYALGGTTDWNGETRTVTVTLDSKVLTMVIDEIIPGFGAAAIIVDSRTYVPIGYVADVLGCDVDWIAATRQVVIVK